MGDDPIDFNGPLLGARSSSCPGPLAGVVDYRGRPITERASTGGWKAALFIIGLQVAETFAFFGVSANLITYLTDNLGQSNASAASAINTWGGVASILPLLGAFVADSCLGRYRTIIIALLLYLLGLGLLASSSVAPALHQAKYDSTFLYFSIYVVALARGFSAPCIQAFGADQFDQNDPVESISKSSFFNWSCLSTSVGGGILFLPLAYVQENIGWGPGFGIQCIVVSLALIAFLVGTRTYRFCSLGDYNNPLARLRRTTITLSRSWRKPGSSMDAMSDGEALSLDQAKLEEVERQIEEAKSLLRLLPIAATCLIFTVVSAQYSTFFTKQGKTLDRRIQSNIEVPPAALQLFIAISIGAFIPIYDRIIVPLARKLTKIPTGFTVLQRTGIGKVVLIITMVIAALVETKRLETARDSGLVDSPDATLPMSCWWLVPQYVIFGIADAFISIGLSEFYYDQSPDSLRSIGIGLSQVFLAIGNFLSGFLVSAIDKATKKTGDGWLSDNLNRAHLDYFYWLLAALSAVELAIYLIVARAYVYKKKTTSAM